MKPRLDPQELTGPDAIAWAGVQWRGGPRFGPALWTRSLMDDSRDAELMLQAQRARYRTFPVDMPPLSMIGGGMVYADIACGGALWDADPVWRHRHST